MRRLVRQQECTTDGESEGIGTWNLIETFLDTMLPSNIKGIGVSVKENLDPKKIRSLIFERAPFLCVDKAVILEKEKNITILTKSVVTNEMCEGHFPGRMIIPLLIFSKIIALSGEILTSWVKNTNLVPLAIRASEVRSVNPVLISPPSFVITEAHFLKEKDPYCWISAAAWVGNKNVAQIKELVYYIMPAAQFFSGAQGGRATARCDESIMGSEDT